MNTLVLVYSILVLGPSMPTAEEVGPSRFNGPGNEYSCSHEAIVLHIVATNLVQTNAIDLGCYAVYCHD